MNGDIMENWTPGDGANSRLDNLKKILTDVLQIMSRDSTDRRRDREIYDLMARVERL